MQCEYKGVVARQPACFLPKFNAVFNEWTPKTVVEIGTHIGGLALFLADVLPQASILTIDIEKMYHSELLTRKNLTTITADAFSSDIYRKLDSFLVDGPALILCDGGDKPREFNLFAKLLAFGDVIMAHDYHHNGIQPPGWPWNEIKFSDVEETVKTYDLEFFMQDEMKEAAWLSMRKA